MKYIYGPVKSRRLGFSLGLSLTPQKVCDFDCIYCQLGRSRKKTVERKEYVKIDEVINELKSWLENNRQEAGKLNYITISGSGEPTLNVNIGEAISRIRKLVNTPIAVITNASLLKEPEVRQALLGADLIVPSLDAVTPKIFSAIDRPHEGLKLEDIIGGLVNLRKEFRGKIWLEVMLVRGVNDDLRQIKKMKEVIAGIKADKIQINSPVRTTAEKGVLPVAKTKLEKIREILGDKCEVV